MSDDRSERDRREADEAWAFRFLLVKVAIFMAIPLLAAALVIYVML